MRPIEITIPILLAIYLLWPLVTRHARPVVIKLIPPLTLLLTLVHFTTEGYRWQMVPAYALTQIRLTVASTRSAISKGMTSANSVRLCPCARDPLLRLK